MRRQRKVKLVLRYSTNAPDAVRLTLINPAGATVWDDLVPADAMQTSARMASYHATPPPGTYRVVVNYRGDEIAQYWLTFLGAKVRIGEVSLSWAHRKTVDDYCLKKVSVELINDGDLPAYCSTVEGEVNGVDIGWYRPEKWIEAGREETISWGKLSDWTCVEPAETYRVKITAYGEEYKVLAKNTLTISSPTVSEEIW